MTAVDGRADEVVEDEADDARQRHAVVHQQVRAPVLQSDNDRQVRHEVPEEVENDGLDEHVVAALLVHLFPLPMEPPHAKESDAGEERALHGAVHLEGLDGLPLVPLADGATCHVARE